MDNPFDQHGFDVRLDWGMRGLQNLLGAARTVVVVDVLSFTTSVDVAVGRGAAVLPFAGPRHEAAAFAERCRARAAAPRASGGWSLSPASLETIPAGTRLVLPSPNGSTLADTAGRHGDTVLAGCLRNASAVAAAAGRTPPVAVIAAGERWESGPHPLRPAVEDLLGAGAVVAALQGLDSSPEATAAAAAFSAARHDLAAHLLAAASGRELANQGFARDVEIAAAHDVSRAVPTLVDGVFVDGEGTSGIETRRRQRPEA